MGHLPRNISTMCSIFIRHGGIIYSTVSGRRQYSRDLPQGGMEIPCTLHFAGNERELKKVEQFFSSIPSILAISISTSQDQSLARYPPFLIQETPYNKKEFFAGKLSRLEVNLQKP